jgi:hypothetical protein
MRTNFSKGAPIDPKRVVEPQATKVLATVAITVTVIETLIAASALVWGPGSNIARETFDMVEFAWRGAWIGLLFLWSIGVVPWRTSGGRLAIVLLIALAGLAIPAVAVHAFESSEQIWSLLYGAAVAAWMLVARLFGLRIGHFQHVPPLAKWRWSLRTIIATVTLSAVVLGIWMAIWRSWVYEREHSNGWLVGLLQVILMILMVATLLHAVALVAAVRWPWTGFLFMLLGPFAAVGTLVVQGKGEIAGAVLFGGFCLSANGILTVVLHYYGWHGFLDTPIWDRRAEARLNSPNEP